MLPMHRSTEAASELRILHVTERFGPSAVGGAQRSVESLAKSHAAGGNEVAVICIHDESEDAERREYPFPVAYVPISPVSRALRKPRLNRVVSAVSYLYEGNIRRCHSQISRVIDQFRPDVINTHILTGIPETVWELGLERRIPLVHTIRDYFITCARSSMFKGGQLCGTPCAECRVVTMRRRKLVRKVGGVVGISERLIDIHRGNSIFGDGQLLRVIPNSIDFGSHGVGAGPKSSFVVGYLGRIVKTKGVEQLIRAFAAAQLPNSRLMIAGDGVAGYVQSLKELGRSSDIEFPGRVDAQTFYGQCDVIAIPSLWEEPFGRVVAEALLMGVPVICSDRGAFPEILRSFPGGRTTRPEDIGQFAADLRAMRASQREYREYLESNRARISRFFSSESIGEQYLDFYGSVVRRHAGS